MEQLLTSLPNTLIGWIATGFFVFGGLVLLFNRIRNDSDKVLRESNDDLRRRMDDQDKTIEELKLQVASLTTTVNTLKVENKTLQDLVIIALGNYFAENPAVAIEMKGRLRK